MFFSLYCLLFLVEKTVAINFKFNYAYFMKELGEREFGYEQTRTA